jgi:hypothetical protein
VPGAGIEPARPYGHKILSLAWLPITPPGQTIALRLFYTVLERYKNAKDNEKKMQPRFNFDIRTDGNLSPQGQYRFRISLRPKQTRCDMLNPLIWFLRSETTIKM